MADTLAAARPGDRDQQQADALIDALSLRIAGRAEEAARWRAEIEALADEWDDEADAADICASTWRSMGSEADDARCTSLADQARTVAERLRAVLDGEQR